MLIASKFSGGQIMERCDAKREQIAQRTSGSHKSRGVRDIPDQQCLAGPDPEVSGTVSRDQEGRVPQVKN